jgi:hypothetical protein
MALYEFRTYTVCRQDGRGGEALRRSASRRSRKEGRTRSLSGISRATQRSGGHDRSGVELFDDPVIGSGASSRGSSN